MLMCPFFLLQFVSGLHILSSKTLTFVKTEHVISLPVIENVLSLFYLAMVLMAHDTNFLAYQEWS